MEADAPLSTRVITAIAAHADEEPHRLSPPLYEVVDLDALDEVARSDASVRVRFEYEGYDVTASSDGDVVVEDRRSDGREVPASA